MNSYRVGYLETNDSVPPEQWVKGYIHSEGYPEALDELDSLGIKYRVESVSIMKNGFWVRIA